MITRIRDVTSAKRTNFTSVTLPYISASLTALINLATGL
jgi:hypothetical protein